MRVISGSARGIKLETIEGLETRPTTDRIKEALFSMINHEIYGAKVLDLFSGSGALAIESASRGAEQVVSVEMNKKCIDVIKKNVVKTHLNDKMVVKRMEVKSFLNMANDKYDIIFMDPPYFQGLIDESVEAILKNDLIKEQGIIVIEHDFKDKIKLDYDSLEVHKEKKYGRTAITIFRRVS